MLWNICYLYCDVYSERRAGFVVTCELHDINRTRLENLIHRSEDDTFMLREPFPALWENQWPAGEGGAANALVEHRF
jgi:hypothetical protein